MRRAPNLRLPLLLVAVAAGWAGPKPNETPVAQALQARGLTKAGTVCTIEDEKPVLAKLKEARTAFKDYAAMSDQQARQQELAQHAGQLDDQRAELQAQLDDLNQRIGDNGSPTMSQGPSGGGGGMGMGMGMGGGRGGMPNQAAVAPLIVRRNQLKQMLGQVTAEQKTIKNQSPQAKDTAALETRVKSADERFRTTLADLRKQVDEVKQKYADLAEDPAVQVALADARKANPKIHLGPSDAFIAGVKELEQAEKRFLGKRTTVVSKKKVKAKR